MIINFMLLFHFPWAKPFLQPILAPQTSFLSPSPNQPSEFSDSSSHEEGCSADEEMERKLKP